ncbi:MAG: GNVR domain-containing protein [Opitutaceae bacterium]
MENNQQQHYQDEDEISLIDLLLVVAKHNRFIIKFTLGVAVLTVLYTLTMPKIFTAKTVILPPQQSGSSASMMLAQLGGLAGAAGGALGIKNPSDTYVGMMKSHTVADHLIDTFKLKSYYQAKTLTATREALAVSTVVTSGKDGFITIEFSDKDPKLATSIANAYVVELDHFNQTLAVTEAAQRRLFFEKQLMKAKEELANAEVALKQTQEKSGLVQLDAQGLAVIKSVADLRAQIAAKEVQLSGMRAFATAQNPDYRQAQELLAGLRAQLAKAERDTAEGNGSVLLPMKKLPESGLEYVRKMREVKYHETLFELLSKQLEMAKLDEAKQSAIIQVVDRAEPPELKSKPKRASIVIIATLMAFFLSVLIAFVREAMANASQDPEQAMRMGLLRQYLRQGR